MAEPSKEDKIIAVLLERFEKQRLPRTLAIKGRVDAGGLLSESDAAFLEQVLVDLGKAKPIADQHADLQALYARVAHLYHEITSKALENEQGQ